MQFYGLAAVTKYVREAAEFVNLYSKWRGVNRLPALTTTMDLLADRPEIVQGEKAIAHIEFAESKLHEGAEEAGS